jgi:DedD protein
MATSQDTEITLGTGKMLLLFFSLVVVCALFFGVGFSLGRSSSPAAKSTGSAVLTPMATSAIRPAAMKATVPTKPAEDLPPASDDASSSPKPASSDSAAVKPASAVEPMSPLATGGYYVQVAAVTKQDDAEALVEALKRKQYAAFAANNSTTDKLYRVQIGPFGDIKEAEGVRAKLISDGYSPILKK